MALSVVGRSPTFLSLQGKAPGHKCLGAVLYVPRLPLSMPTGLRCSSASSVGVIGPSLDCAYIFQGLLPLLLALWVTADGYDPNSFCFPDSSCCLQGLTFKETWKLLPHQHLQLLLPQPPVTVIAVSSSIMMLKWVSLALRAGVAKDKYSWPGFQGPL